MTIKIDQVVFMMTFAADAGFHAELEGHETYLQRSSGDLIDTLTDVDDVAMNYGESAVEDFRDGTELVNEHPERYLLIESMSHGEHHSVLQDFLETKWTKDQASRDHARDVYYPRKSIGFWLKNVGDQRAIDSYFAFKTEEHIRLAEKYLRENGVTDFKWI